MIEEVLFVRSVPVPVSLRALESLRAGRPDVRVHVLTPAASAAVFERSALCDRVLTHEGGRFGLSLSGIRMATRLRRRRFDTVVVPFVGRFPHRFWNVARFARAIGPRRVVWMPCDLIRAATDLDSCRRVRLAGHTLSSAVKYPFLIALTLVTSFALMVFSGLLLPLVWLTPFPLTEADNANL